jgi:ATP-binding cassette subfamily B protein
MTSPGTADAAASSSRSLAAYARAQVPRYVAGGACLLATNALGMVIPWLVKLAVDALHQQEPDALEVTTHVALAIIALATLQAGIRTLSRIVIFNGGREVEFRLRQDLFEHVMALPQAFHRRHTTGELMSRLTNDLSAVRMLFGPGILNIMNTAMVYVTGLTLMSRLSLRLTLLAVVPLPIVVILGQLASRRIYGASRDLQAQMGDLSSHLQEDFSGIATLRAYTLENLRERRFAAANEGYLRRSLDLVRTRGTLGPVFAVVGGLGTLIVLWLGGKEVIQGRLTIGELVAFNAYLVYLAWPTLALGWVLSLWQRGLAGWNRVREVLAAPALAPLADGAIPTPGTAAIEARHLTIDLPGGRRVLDDVSFRVEPGRTLALVGRTGSGKSTLADALLRLAEVPEGALFVGGRDVTRQPLVTLRGNAAYAPQDPFLFSATVAENIGFGKRGLEEAELAGRRTEIHQAARDAGLARDLGELPDGLDTVVGERGITLSGGQRQRVALARALFADAPLIILDDSLSSVDAETEREILTRLRGNLAGRTAVLVSHRVAAVADADLIIVLDEGRIVQQGRHHELVAAGGTYASLYREQIEKTAEPAAT